MDLNISNMSSDTGTKADQVSSVKLLIIGSGPAGLSAALYAARADLDPIVIAGMELGGQVSLTDFVENYPGFPDGIKGSELVNFFQQQAERFGAKVEFDTVIEVELSERPFKIKTYSTLFKADTLIVTTGATPIHLNISGERELTGKGVSYCATCDGWFFKGKDVLVVGGGDSALEEGIFLTRFAKSVTIIHRRDNLRAGKILQHRAFENPKIKFIWNSTISEILGKDKVEAVKIINIQSGEIQHMEIDGVFIFIGHAPNTDLFDGQLKMDQAKYLITDKFMKTNIQGVFAAGEVTDPNFRQVITSAGMGAAAAMQAIHFIQEHKDEQK